MCIRDRYGASAVNGYLAQDTIFELVDEGLLDKDYYAAIEDYNDGILHGICLLYTS